MCARCPVTRWQRPAEGGGPRRRAGDLAHRHEPLHAHQASRRPPEPRGSPIRALTASTLGQVDTVVSDPVVGVVLEGRYRLEERLARGGMSTVYSATDL